jgi:hypothetical protein
VEGGSWYVVSTNWHVCLYLQQAYLAASKRVES